MSRATSHDALVVGGEPRVNLLPPAVAASRKARATRRLLGIIVVGVVLLAGAGTAAAAWRASLAQAELEAAQARTTQLLQEQVKYAQVRTIQEEVNLAAAARRVGAATEVDWKAYLIGIRSVLPHDVTIDTVTVDAASPLAVYEQPTAPLQAERVATVRMTLRSPGLPTVPDWLDAMKALPGYADGTPNSITQDGTGAYSIELTIHVNKGAYSKRFAAAEGK
jgi:hypothetical protein